MRMQDYVVDVSSELKEKINKLSLKAVALLIEGDFQQAESIFQSLYKDIRKDEERLPEGQRFHKGDTLYWWGFALLLQKTSDKVSEGYEKMLLAYIEDLLDFETIQEARKAPACTALAQNPAIGKPLLDLVQHQVENIKARHQVPKSPEEVVKPLSDKTQEALEKPIDITFVQVKPTIQQWLKEMGPKEKRVFIGGNYRNIAILRFIEQVVRDVDFVPIMPINLPATSKPTYEKLIHDISIELLRECSFAIFEVTVSDGHLMEIERAKDFTNLRTILVYQTTKHEEKPTVTRMLMTTKFEKQGYRNFTELTTKINSFLAQD